MSPSRDVLVTALGLGGTIFMTGPDGAVSITDLIGALPDLGVPGLTVEGCDLRSVPGSSLNFSDVYEVALAAGDSEGAGVVIVQGTDTIEETAWALDLLCTGDRPIVITGAMHNPMMAGADGMANLTAAVQVAASGLRGVGCVVVMDGEIHAARYVRKVHTMSTGAFASPGTGPLGRVTDGRVCLMARPPGRFTVRGTPGVRIPRVGLYTATLGDDGEALRAMGRRCDGVVVAGFGAGNVPEPLVPIMTELIQRIPVVVASRTGAGPVVSASYGHPGSLRDLALRGAFSTGFLDPLKSRVLMHVLLAAGRERDEVLNAFATIDRATDPSSEDVHEL